MTARIGPESVRGIQKRLCIRADRSIRFFFCASVMLGRRMLSIRSGHASGWAYAPGVRSQSLQTGRRALGYFGSRRKLRPGLHRQFRASERVSTVCHRATETGKLEHQISPAPA